MPFFADDTNLFCIGKNLGDIVNEINVGIDKIYSRVKANKLSLNVEKTNFMFFTPKCFPRNMDHLLINGNRISEMNETKFLGVIFDNELNWSPHIMPATRLLRVWALSRGQERCLTMKHFSPCSIHLFIHTSTIVSMYGVKHMIRIFIF